MGDQYIKNLMDSIEKDEGSSFPINSEPKKVKSPRKKVFINKSGNKLTDRIKLYELNGNKKRLIKIDEQNEDVLKHFSYVFNIDVTKLINFILDDFFKQNPSLVIEIKKNINE